MESWMVAILVKPLAVLLIFGVFGLGTRWLIHRWMPEGRIKHELLKHRGGTKDSLSR